MRGVALLGVMWLVSGCGGAEPAAAPAASPVGSSARTPQPAHTAISKPVTARAIVEHDGVSLGRSTSSADHFAFGAERAAVESAAERVFGTPPKRSANGECGAGPMEFSRFEGLTLNFQKGRLVGWLARQDPHISASDGIKPGMAWRDLRVVRSAKLIEGSTLEGEFEYLAADGQPVGGFVVGEGRDGKVESLYAGANCFFR